MDIIDHESRGEERLPVPACTVIPDCPMQTDLVLVSSDGKRFGTHCKNLGEFTGGFPVDIVPSKGEEVQMPDLGSQALSIFLQYVHHHRQPDLSDFPFTTLAQLAEAVEKYDVYSATEVCKLRMWQSASDYSVEVFRYADKHGYRKLMDHAALIVVQDKYKSSKLSQELYLCSQGLQAAWRRYNGHWRDWFDDCYNAPLPVLHRGGEESCKFWKKFRNSVVSQVKREIGTFSSFPALIAAEEHRLQGCLHCGIRAKNWTGRVMRHQWESMPNFTSFL